MPSLQTKALVATPIPRLCLETWLVPPIQRLCLNTSSWLCPLPWRFGLLLKTSDLKLFTAANLRYQLVNNTKLPCYTLSPTQHHRFFRNVPLYKFKVLWKCCKVYLLTRKLTCGYWRCSNRYLVFEFLRIETDGWALDYHLRFACFLFLFFFFFSFVFHFHFSSFEELFHFNSQVQLIC